MQLVFGDLHGDLENLVRLTTFLNKNPDARNIQEMLFTGDWFGLPPHQDHEGLDYQVALQLREQQYREIKEILQRIPESIELFQVPGNYDRALNNTFPDQDIHHKTTSLESGLIFGHGGSQNYLTGFLKKITDPENYNEDDFFFIDQEKDFELLEQTDPSLVLSHSPSRAYVNHFLTTQPSDQQTEQPRKLIYLGGHTHVQQFRRITSQLNQNEVYIIRPGALGRTRHAHTKEILPSTFMMFDPTKQEYPQPCTLYTLENLEITKQPLTPQNLSLQQYNDDEGKWRPRDQETKRPRDQETKITNLNKL